MATGCLTAVDPDWLCGVDEHGEGVGAGFAGRGIECGEETAGEGVAWVCEGGLCYGVVLQGY